MDVKTEHVRFFATRLSYEDQVLFLAIFFTGEYDEMNGHANQILYMMDDIPTKVFAEHRVELGDIKASIIANEYIVKLFFDDYTIEYNN